MAQIIGGPHRGHAAGDTDAEKAASQLVSDIKYKVGLELKKKGGASHMNPAQVAQQYAQKLAASPAPGPVKALAKKKLGGGGLKEEYNIGKLAQESIVNALNKVFVEGIEEPVAPNEYLLQLEQTEEKKYKIRVTDKKTGNTYVRMATRDKIAELRANPNISSVEMTSYGEPSETEAKRGSQTASALGGGSAKKDYDGDGDVESGAKEHAGAVHNAIQRRKGGTPDGKDTSNVKEEFISEVDNTGTKKKIGDEKVNNKKFINLKPLLSTMESVEPEPSKPSTLQKFQTQQKPNPAVDAKNKQVVQIQKKQLTDKMAQLNKGVPLTQSYQPEGEELDKKTQINAEDPRSIPTKVNLLKNKLRAAGMRNPIVMMAAEETDADRAMAAVRANLVKKSGEASILNSRAQKEKQAAQPKPKPQEPRKLSGYSIPGAPKGKSYNN